MEGGSMSDRATLGDFGAGGRRSKAGDALIDTKEAAQEAAVEPWEYEAHTSELVAWHVPGTVKTLQLRKGEHGWRLRRGERQIGSRAFCLADGLNDAHEFMEDYDGD